MAAKNVLLCPTFDFLFIEMQTNISRDTQTLHKELIALVIAKYRACKLIFTIYELENILLY